MQKRKKKKLAFEMRLALKRIDTERKINMNN